MKNTAIIMIFFAGLLASCTKEAERSSTNAAVQQDLKNESYGPDARNRFDIYLPAGRSDTATPVLFFIHGGGWVGGSKDDVAAGIPAIRQLYPNAAVVAMSYRLYNVQTGANKFPAQEEDVKKCIEYVLQQKEHYHISGKFVLWGQSAGAHLAMLYAYKYGNATYRPKAVVNQVGPVDLRTMYDQLATNDLRVLMKGLIGDPATRDSVLFHSSSPYRYVSAQSAPTLIMQGTADALVPWQQAEMLKNALVQYNVPYVYKLYPGQDHSLSGVQADVVTTLTAFLNTYLR